MLYSVGIMIMVAWVVLGGGLLVYSNSTGVLSLNLWLVVFLCVEVGVSVQVESWLVYGFTSISLKVCVWRPVMGDELSDLDSDEWVYVVDRFSVGGTSTDRAASCVGFGWKHGGAPVGRLGRVTSIGGIVLAWTIIESSGRC